MQKNKSRIVIVGGGAGGLELATSLGHKLGYKKQAQITLVDKSLTHLWKPLLHEECAGTLNQFKDEVNYISHAYNNGFDFILGEIVSVDRPTKTIKIKYPLKRDKDLFVTVSYDILILAIGAVSNNFNTPGADRFCYYLDDVEEAKRVHQHFLRKVVEGRYEQQYKPYKIVIVGGGATGVELAAELHTAAEEIRKLQPPVLPSIHAAKITLIEAAPRILSMLPERISKITLKKLNDLKVKVITDERVTKVMKHSLETDKDRMINADIVIWAAGVKGHPVAEQLGDFELNRAQQIKVKPTLQTTVDDNIFAFGDCAACPMPNSDKIVPARAQAANQQATLLTKSIQLHLQGKSLPNYFYRDRGSLISLSSKGSIGQLMGKLHKSLLIEGWLARLTYLFLYKQHQAKLFGWWRVFLMTIANFLTRKLRVRLKLH